MPSTAWIMVGHHKPDLDVLAVLGDPRPIDPVNVLEILTVLCEDRERLQHMLNTDRNPKTGRKLGRVQRLRVFAELRQAVADLEGLVAEYRMIFGDAAAVEMMESTGFPESFFAGDLP